MKESGSIRNTALHAMARSKISRTKKASLGNFRRRLFLYLCTTTAQLLIIIIIIIIHHTWITKPNQVKWKFIQPLTKWLGSGGEAAIHKNTTTATTTIPDQRLHNIPFQRKIAFIHEYHIHDLAPPTEPAIEHTWIKQSTLYE